MVVIAGGLGGCVAVKSVRKEELPAAWQAALPRPNTAPGDISGIYRAEGQYAHGDGKLVAGNLSSKFFAGKPVRATRLELRLTASGQLVVTALDGRLRGISATYQTEKDPATGSILVKDIDLDPANKFGATATSDRVRLLAGSDRALYVESTSYGGGVVLFVPAVGYFHSWSRYERE